MDIVEQFRHCPDMRAEQANRDTAKHYGEQEIMDRKQYSPLGQRITELQGRMTETDLCERSNLSRNQLYNIKRGKTGTSLPTIERLVALFKSLGQENAEDLYRLAGFIAPSTVTPLPTWLRDIRTQRGLTQQDLAEGMLSDVGEIEALEAGTRKLDDVVLMRLLMVLQPATESSATLSTEDRRRVDRAKTESELFAKSLLGSEESLFSGKIIHVTGPSIDNMDVASQSMAPLSLQRGEEYLKRISRDPAAYSIVLPLLEYWANSLSEVSTETTADE